MRAPGGEPLRWQLSADVEALAWNPCSPTSFLVSCEDGLVAAFDARAGAAPLFRLSAHDKPTCAMSFCAAAPGLLATGSTDKKVRRPRGRLGGAAQALVALRDGVQLPACPSA